MSEWTERERKKNVIVVITSIENKKETVSIEEYFQNHSAFLHMFLLFLKKINNGANFSAVTFTSMQSGNQ